MSRDWVRLSFALFLVSFHNPRPAFGVFVYLIIYLIIHTIDKKYDYHTSFWYWSMLILSGKNGKSLYAFCRYLLQRCILCCCHHYIFFYISALLYICFLFHLKISTGNFRVIAHPYKLLTFPGFSK